jgi:ketosteroid isomerase-like protein
MKKLALSFVLLAATLLAQAGGPEAGMRAWAAAVLANDDKTLETLLADDLIYTHSDARQENKHQYIDSMKTGALKYLELKLSEVKVRQYGNVAVVNAMGMVKAIDHGKNVNPTLRIVHVWLKGKGGWQLSTHQTTRLP